MTTITMSAASFNEQLACPDTRIIEYARGAAGYVSKSRERITYRSPSAESVTVSECANEAWRACQAGLVSLAQRKNGLDDYSYLAIKVRP
jgi:hypothetical protein